MVKASPPFSSEILLRDPTRHLFPTVVATIYTILTLPSLLSIHTIKLRYVCHSLF